MTSTRRRTVLAALTTVCILSFTGVACGSSQGSGAPPSTTDATPTSSTSQQPTDGTTTSDQTSAATSDQSSAASSETSSVASSSGPSPADLVPDAVKKSTMQVATNPEYPPVTFVDENTKERTGFAVDLMDAIAVKLELPKPTYTGVKGIPAYVTGVTSGRFQTAIASITDTKEREEQVDFVDYAQNFLATVVATGNPQGIHGPETYCGKTFAVLKGASSVKALQAMQPACKDNPLTITELSTDADAQLQVKSGRAAATVQDAPVAEYVTANTQGLEIVKDAPKLAPGLVGILVDKKMPEFSKAIKMALDELRADGTYDSILKKWNVSEIAIDEFSVNGATA